MIDKYNERLRKAYKEYVNEAFYEGKEIIPYEEFKSINEKYKAIKCSCNTDGDCTC
jgi:hypothetical protein